MSKKNRRERQAARMERIKAQLGAQSEGLPPEGPETAPQEIEQETGSFDSDFSGVVEKNESVIPATEPEQPAAKVRELKWFMITDFNLIPRYLIEQIKDRQYTIEQFYQIGNVIERDPFQQVYVLLNEERMIKGFMWLAIVPFSKEIFVHAISVDREYRDGEGGPVEYALELLKDIHARLQLTGAIRFSTTKPEYYERLDFKRSKFVLMEV